jgi:hypothetical protein
MANLVEENRSIARRWLDLVGAHQVDEKKRLALETWARVLKGILEKTNDANVVAFSATRA